MPLYVLEKNESEDEDSKESKDQEDAVRYGLPSEEGFYSRSFYRRRAS